jgi:hypothetical protein
MEYDTGFRNFNSPEDAAQSYTDKVFKKLVSIHDGAEGTVTIYWETERATNSFTFDLSVYPKRFETFFHPEACGRLMKFRIYKNDLSSFTQKELHCLYTPEPVIV